MAGDIGESPIKDLEVIEDDELDEILGIEEEPELKVVLWQKKPVIIEGVQYLKENAKQVAEWCAGTLSIDLGLYVDIGDGTLQKAIYGDWIIVNSDGDLDIMKDKLLKKLYDEMLEP